MFSSISLCLSDKPCCGFSGVTWIQTMRKSHQLKVQWQASLILLVVFCRKISHSVRAPPLDSNGTPFPPLSVKPRDHSVKFRFCVYDTRSGLICKRWRTNREQRIGCYLIYVPGG